MRIALYPLFMLRLLYTGPFALYDIAKMDDWIVFKITEHVIKTQEHEVM